MKKFVAQPVPVANSAIGRNRWVRDQDVSTCMACVKRFSLVLRKHHCRFCGGVFCHTCSHHVIKLKVSGRKGRACAQCWRKAKEGKLAIQGEYSAESISGSTFEEDAPSTASELGPNDSFFETDEREDEPHTPLRAVVSNPHTPRSYHTTPGGATTLPLLSSRPIEPNGPSVPSVSKDGESKRRTAQMKLAFFSQDHIVPPPAPAADNAFIGGELDDWDSYEPFREHSEGGKGKPNDMTWFHEENEGRKGPCMRAADRDVMLTLGGSEGAAFFRVHPDTPDSWLLLLSLSLYCGCNAWGVSCLTISFGVLFWHRVIAGRRYQVS
eukprot:gb/GEZN01008743.1/.p1 GENE.gb/GEZN01008743.1/~~gb/GEZN01008743.1/.p1  ORF type:complete len:338 (+),score=29.38 gb/GEZN01008743.1/:43-1014(+)